MKLQFKHQPFQAEAAAAVCDVFRGQSLCAQAHRQGLGAAVDGLGRQHVQLDGRRRGPEDGRRVFGKKECK